MITSINKGNSEKYAYLYEQASLYLMTHDEDGNVVPEGSDNALMEGREYDREGNITKDPSITSLDEYFTYIKFLAKAVRTGKTIIPFTKLPVDEEYLVIDGNTRAITVPKAFQTNGISVKGDEISEIVYFKINRYYDIDDLATKKIYIQWKDASGEEGTVEPCFSSVEVEPGYLIFGWPLTSEMTKVEGALQFSVRFYTLGVDGTLTYSFSTLTQTVMIKPALNYDVAKIAADGTALNVSDDIVNRLVNSSNTVTGIEPEAPVFIEDLNLPSKGYYDVDEEAKTSKVNLLNGTIVTDSENHTQEVTWEDFTASAQAKVGDAGKVTYSWNKLDLNTGRSSEISYRSDYVQTNDAAKVEGKSYYTEQTSPEGIKVYKLYMGDTFIIKVADGFAYTDTDEKILEKKTYAVFDSVGTYKCVASNRVRAATKETDSYVCVVPAPKAPVITTDVAERAYLTLDRTAEEVGPVNTVLSVVSDDTIDEGLLTYQWYKKDTLEDEYAPIAGAMASTYTVLGKNQYDPDEEHALGDGFYKVEITNNLNRESENLMSGECRVTHTPEKLLVTVDGNSKFTLSEARKDGLRVDVAYPEGSGEEAQRTAEDTITYQWYRYSDRMPSGDNQHELEYDAAIAERGEYEMHYDIDLSKLEGVDPETTRTDTYIPAEGGYTYFCEVTNTYNGKQSKRCSPFFTVTRD